MIIAPKKRTVHAGGAFEDTALTPGFGIVKFYASGVWNRQILHQLVESQLLAF
jgi:hypothetical protein